MSSNPGNPEAMDIALAPAAAGKETSFQKLQKRSFGGEDVAARPGAEDDAWWPKGPLLPGVEDLAKDFVAGIAAPESLRLVFLLGGAGNGKSFAARSLGEELGLQATSGDPLARRIYTTTRNGAKIALLNDATIAPSEDYNAQQAVALATDIQRWFDDSVNGPVAAFCCVNRGIVIDELRSLSENDGCIGAFAEAVLAWLASPELDLAGRLSVSLEEPKLVLGDHYHELGFTFDGRVVRISAMSVDACSLMDADGASSRAGALFQQVVQKCRDDAMGRPLECPIRANVLQWSPVDSIECWETILSHAEIASGRLHSYRDIWGLAALSILGPRFATSDGARSLLEHIDFCLDKARDGSTPKEKLDALLELSHFRAHNALFRAPIPTGELAQPSYPPTTPAHFGLSLVDPSIWGAADSQAVESAMQRIALGGLPSDSLREGGLLGVSWAEFDQRLEKAIVEFVGGNDCSDTMRRRLVSWYGGYLMRLVAVGTGRIGNQSVVAQWEQCRECARNSGLLPIEFEKAVRSLIFPQHDAATPDTILVPAFAARVEPLQSFREGASPTLAEIIPHNSINLRVTQKGGRLVLECTLTGKIDVIGQLVLDFPLIREALACRGRQAGQTESTVRVEPRIERCRASSLGAVPANQRRLVVISGGRPMELT